MERKQQQWILKDLERKMVFIVGPRQAGKTYLAKMISTGFKSPVYLNYDRLEDRKIITNEQWLTTTDLLILDELHKMPQWKNYLKGVYDTKSPNMKIMVTGSARLDIFNQVGDSLAGRFFIHRLMPLSLSEIKATGNKSDIDRLLERGGFPEPYLAEDSVDANRWRMQYIDSLIRTDVLDFENIHNLRAIQTVLELLRQRVGSPISYKAIAEDVSISPNTVKKYIHILEALYIVFRVTPFSRNIARSLLKEPKIYFYDIGMVKGDEGVKFENLIAISLLKHVYALVDYKAEPYMLHYIRNRDSMEVDFALVKDNQLQQLIEAKYSNHKVGKSLQYFHDKYGIKATQVVKDLKRQRLDNSIEIVAAEQFLSELFL